METVYVLCDERAGKTSHPNSLYLIQYQNLAPDGDGRVNAKSDFCAEGGGQLAIMPKRVESWECSHLAKNPAKASLRSTPFFLSLGQGSF